MENPGFLAEKSRGQNVRQAQQPTVRAETWKMQRRGAQIPHISSASSLLTPGPHLCWVDPPAPGRVKELD